MHDIFSTFFRSTVADAFSHTELMFDGKQHLIGAVSPRDQRARKTFHRILAASKDRQSFSLSIYRMLILPAAQESYFGGSLSNSLALSVMLVSLGRWFLRSIRVLKTLKTFGTILYLSRFCISRSIKSSKRLIEDCQERFHLIIVCNSYSHCSQCSTFAFRGPCE